MENISEDALREMYSDERGFLRFTDRMHNDKVRKRHEAFLGRISSWLRMTGDKPPRLLDVGAGSGQFLNLARTQGFEVYGTELSKAAISFARDRYNLELDSRPLAADDRSGFFDVITMWGLIEHVLEPFSMLNEAFRLLSPGGLLYIYTPIWCLYDDIGLGLARLSVNRWTRLLDRRITQAHLQLFSRASLLWALTRIGFEVMPIEQVCEYNLPVTAYLESLGVPGTVRPRVANLLDWLIDRGFFFKNNMRVLCNKPTAL